MERVGGVEHFFGSSSDVSIDHAGSTRRHGAGCCDDLTSETS
jgi:hypothetical protein